MRTRLTIVFMLLSVFVAGCASESPTAVKIAREKECDSMLTARENLKGFSQAALADLEAALLEQIDREFEARLAVLADADGRAALVDVKKEIALAAAARRQEREAMRGHLATLDCALRDLDNAIALNMVLGEYLDREHLSAQDVAEMLRRIDAILGEGK